MTRLTFLALESKSFFISSHAMNLKTFVIIIHPHGDHGGDKKSMKRENTQENKIHIFEYDGEL